MEKWLDRVGKQWGLFWRMWVPWVSCLCLVVRGLKENDPLFLSSCSWDRAHEFQDDPQWNTEPILFYPRGQVGTSFHCPCFHCGAVDYDEDLLGLLFLCLVLPSFHVPAFTYNWIWRSFTQLEIKWSINRYVCSLFIYLNTFLTQT